MTRATVAEGGGGIGNNGNGEYGSFDDKRD